MCEVPVGGPCSDQGCEDVLGVQGLGTHVFLSECWCGGFYNSWQGQAPHERSETHCPDEVAWTHGCIAFKQLECLARFATGL